MESNIEVLVLCGGEGKRLRSMISEVPKPMAPIGQKPFLDYLITSIEKQGFRKICLLTGYKSEIIEQYFSEHFTNLEIRFSIEDAPLGTGGAVLKAVKSSTSSLFLVINGDTYFDIDLKGFSEKYERGSFKMALRFVTDTSRYGRVEVSDCNLVTSFVEKNSANSQAEGLINGGVYLFDKDTYVTFADQAGFASLENEIMPKLLESKKIYSQSFNDDFIDIGVPEDYIRAKLLIEKWANRSR